jgi:phospholipase D1/2
LVTGQALESQFLSGLKKLSLKGFDLAKLPEEGIKSLYGLTDDVILYWAHHEKLCLVDGKQAFMGGLDLCFGRWDSNSHPIADAHPTDLDQALFPGQDYNNARIYDFEDVSKIDMNKLDRKLSSRMGWSDLSICLQGSMVEDLRAHFVQRWNYIYAEKYDVRKDDKYEPLTLTDTSDGYYKTDGKNVVKIDENAKPTNSEEESDMLGLGAIRHRFRQLHIPGVRQFDASQETESSGVSVQLVRSCTKWSNGVATEVNILAPI